MESCGGGNHSEQVSIDPWEVRERLRVHQSEDPWPEDPWEVRERLLVTRGGERTAFSRLPSFTDLYYGFRKQR